MVHLYFGAFDVLMYLGGIYTALVFSKAICDQMDEATAVGSSVDSTIAAEPAIGQSLAPRRAIASSVPATVAQPSRVRVGVPAR